MNYLIGGLVFIFVLTSLIIVCWLFLFKIPDMKDKMYEEIHKLRNIKDNLDDKKKHS